MNSVVRWSSFQRSGRVISASFGSSATTKHDNIIYRMEGAARIISINKLQQKNSLTPEDMLDLGTAVRTADDDSSTKVIAITGNGDFFCSGFDLLSYEKAPDVKSFAEKTGNAVKHLVGTLIDCKKPVVALVNGPGMGIGLTMLGLCDATYAVEKAWFKAPFSSLGICAEGGSSFTFPLIMGFGKAAHLLMFDQKITAKGAHECGLVTELLSSETFQEESLARLSTIANLPLQSLVYSKELIRGPDRELLHEVNRKESIGIETFIQGEDFKNAAARFFEKRRTP